HARPAPSVADRVAPERQRHATDVAYGLPLALEERVNAVSGDDDEEPAEPEILDVRPAGELAAHPRRLREPEVIELPTLLVDRPRILAPRDPSRDVEPVTAADEPHRELLDEALEARRLIPSAHAKRPSRRLIIGSVAKAPNPSDREPRTKPS